jgi:hypothetical protein
MSQLSRRSFLKQAGVGLAGFSLLPALARIAPSDRFRVAHIGLMAWAMSI